MLFKELLAIFSPFQPSIQLKQVNPFVCSKKEAEALCQNGVMGLEGVWAIYDMWI